MENPSLTLHACKERTPGCPSSTRAPSPAFPWGCTDFKLLQAGKAGDVWGYCMWGRSSSCQWRRFMPGPQNCFFFSKVLARVLVSACKPWDPLLGGPTRVLVPWLGIMELLGKIFKKVLLPSYPVAEVCTGRLGRTLLGRV